MSKRVLRSASHLASEVEAEMDKMAPQEVHISTASVVLTTNPVAPAITPPLPIVEETPCLPMEVEPPAMDVQEPGPSRILNPSIDMVQPTPPSPASSSSDAETTFYETGNVSPRLVTSPVSSAPSNYDSEGGSSGGSNPPTPLADEISVGPIRDLRRRVPHRGELPHHDPNTVGDHSVEASGAYESLLATSPYVPEGPATFVQHYAASFQNVPNIVRFHQGVFSLSSYLLQAETASNYRNQVRIESPILMTTRGPVPEERMPLMHVQWGPTAKKYDLDMTKLTPFYTGATINDKAVQNGLAPYLKITNQAVMRAIGDNLLESQYSTHNYAIYAKLIWYSLVRDLFTQTEAAPVLQPFPDGFDPIFVNLGDAQLHPAAVTNPIRNGNIILVEGYDWSLADLQALMWLAKPGNRYTGVVAQNIPHAAYVSWPGVNVVVYRTEAAPVLPPIEDVDPQVLYNLALKMAQVRGETECLLAGLYWVLDYIGIRWIRGGGRRANVQRHVHPFYGANSLRLPQPWDYNVMLRILGVKPPNPGFGLSETQTWMQCAPMNRVNIAVLYAASIYVFSTTYLYSLQIAAERIVEWTTGGILPLTASALIPQMNLPRQAAEHYTENIFIRSVKSCFARFFGVDVYRRNHHNEEWLGAHGGVPQIGENMAQWAQAIPPFFANPLVIDNFLAVRPLEWGITAPCPRASFYQEVVTTGVEAMRGWFSSMGDAKYKQQAEGRMGYVVVPYGAFAVNAILQYFRIGAPVLLSSEQLPVTPQGVSRQAGIIPLIGAVFLPDLNLLQPCTLMSFNDPAQMILPVCFMFGNIVPGDLTALSRTREMKLDNVGILLAGNVSSPAPAFEYPASFDMADFTSPASHAQTADAAASLRPNPD